jgi:hypothetical protein
MTQPKPDVGAIIDDIAADWSLAPPRVELLELARIRFTPDGENPNRMDPEDFQLLTLSIGREGFDHPILVRPLPGGQPDGCDYEMADGNHRGRAVRALGGDMIPAVVREMTDQQLRGYRIARNRLRGRIDLTIARLQVRDLAAGGLTLDELLVTGFGVDDLTAFCAADVSPVAAGLGSMTVSDDSERLPKPFVIEIPFTDKAQYQRALKRLRKAAGKTKDLGLGLLNVLGELKAGGAK